MSLLGLQIVAKPATVRQMQPSSPAAPAPFLFLKIAGIFETAKVETTDDAWIRLGFFVRLGRLGVRLGVRSDGPAVPLGDRGLDALVAGAGHDLDFLGDPAAPVASCLARPTKAPSEGTTWMFGGLLRHPGTAPLIRTGNLLTFATTPLSGDGTPMLQGSEVDVGVFEGLATIDEALMSPVWGFDRSKPWAFRSTLSRAAMSAVRRLRALEARNGGLVPAEAGEMVALRRVVGRLSTDPDYLAARGDLGLPATALAEMQAAKLLFFADDLEEVLPRPRFLEETRAVSRILKKAEKASRRDPVLVRQ